MVPLGHPFAMKTTSASAEIATHVIDFTACRHEGLLQSEGSLMGRDDGSSRSESVAKTHQGSIVEKVGQHGVVSLVSIPP